MALMRQQRDPFKHKDTEKVNRVQGLATLSEIEMVKR